MLKMLMAKIGHRPYMQVNKLNSRDMLCERGNGANRIVDEILVPFWKSCTKGTVENVETGSPALGVQEASKIFKTKAGGFFRLSLLGDNCQSTYVAMQIAVSGYLTKKDFEEIQDWLKIAKSAVFSFADPLFSLWPINVDPKRQANAFKPAYLKIIEGIETVAGRVYKLCNELDLDDNISKFKEVYAIEQKGCFYIADGSETKTSLYADLFYLTRTQLFQGTFLGRAISISINEISKESQECHVCVTSTEKGLKQGCRRTFNISTNTSSALSITASLIEAIPAIIQDELIF